MSPQLPTFEVSLQIIQHHPTHHHHNIWGSTLQAILNPNWIVIKSKLWRSHSLRSKVQHSHCTKKQTMKLESIIMSYSKKHLADRRLVSYNNWCRTMQLLICYRCLSVAKFVSGELLERIPKHVNDEVVHIFIKLVLYYRWKIEKYIYYKF